MKSSSFRVIRVWKRLLSARGRDSPAKWRPEVKPWHSLHQCLAAASRGEPQQLLTTDREALARQTVSERGDNYCSGQLGSSVLSWGNGRRGCRPSRGSTGRACRHKHTEKSSELCVGRKLGVADSHAELVMKTLTVARSTTNKLPGNVCFQASAGTKKDAQTNIFLLQRAVLCTEHNNTYISVFDLKERKSWWIHVKAAAVISKPICRCSCFV